MEINGQNTGPLLRRTRRPNRRRVFHPGWPRGFEKNTWHSGMRTIPTGPLDYQAVEPKTFTAPQGYSDVSAHQANFFNAVANRKPTVEMKCLVIMRPSAVTWRINAYFKNTIATWDAGGKRFG